MAQIPNPYSEFLREPNLLIPGKKPVGAVKVDWSHSLAQGLEDYWLFNGQQGDTVKNLGYDDGADLNTSGLLVNHYWTPVPTLVQAGAQQQISPGMSLQTDYLASAGRLPYAGYSSGSEKNYGNTYTIIIKYSLHALGSDVSIAGPTGEHYTKAYFINAKYHAAGGSYHQFSYTALDTMAGHFQTFIVSRNGNTVTLYRDAAVLDTYASFGTTDYKCFCLGGSTANGYLGRQGNVYCGIWMRELTASEIASVTSDPYQFLIPA